MRTVAHVYPWDVVGDPDAVSRVASLGVDAVALAASYHTVRAATPFHPRHRLVDARHAAFYLPVRDEAWRGKRLRPAEPSWVDGPDPYGEASALLRGAGLPVYAWTVLTHSSRLGEANPDLVVRNAFGDAYPYALCPSNDDVAEYASTLVSEVLELGRPDGVVLEACGPLGFFHGGHHEKTDGADWSPVQQKLLSLCFCAACATRYTDPEGLREAVRTGIDSGARVVEEALGERAAHVREVRADVSRALRRRLVGEIRAAAPDVRIGAHATADPWGTGPFATVAGGVDADVDVLTLTCWPGVDASLPAIRALRAEAPGVRTAAYVLALPPKPVDGDALLREWVAYAEAGVEEFHLYHAGLASEQRLDALRHAVAGIGDHLNGW
ncbi:hypothetical protein [Saccharothrix yanglingensis]|uniref:hypothetical protein n=1 Tax=Saccharothrix yanglingensis TaxID=659496 RepID=UPI0027D238C2|nr:hypothetical protein [Saccharothrix yanglingensis]